MTEVQQSESDTTRFLRTGQIKTYHRAVESAGIQNDVEKAMESATNAVLLAYFTNRYGTNRVVHSYPYLTDGLIQVFEDPEKTQETFRVLIETKQRLVFSGREGKPDRAKVAAQALFYLKKFERAGEPIPQTIVIADVNEMFILPSKVLLPYLKADGVSFVRDDGSGFMIDWTAAPSSAYQLNFELYEELINDKNMNRYVEDITVSDFDIEAFCRKLDNIARNQEIQKIRIDHLTLAKAFEDFQRLAFGGQTGDKNTKVVFDGKKKSLTYTQVQVFIKTLLGDDNIFLDPMRKNELIILYKDYKGNEKVFRYPPSSKFMFDADSYEIFFDKYDRTHYTIAERKAITEIADTLLEEFDRRYTGDYWTPTIWVNEAHKMIEEQLGKDWKEEYVVWDPACGSKNLTRDYRFKELYCSTLHQEELNIAEDYNPEATSFQYDFLNDDIDIHKFSDGLDFGEDDSLDLSQFKLPKGLIEALQQKKPIVLFANPPYGKASKSQMAQMHNTEINKIMKGIEYNVAAQELYTQFIYRVMLFAKSFNYDKDLHFFFFFNKTFLVAKSFLTFTNNLTSKFTFQSGFMLNAGEFKGTSSAWGIIFSHWRIGQDKVQQNQFSFDVKLNIDNNIETTEKWIAKKPKDLLSKFLQKKRNNLDRNLPNTANGFSNSQAKTQLLGGDKNSFGYLNSHGDAVQHCDKSLQIFSLTFAGGNGFWINESDFEDSLIVFSAKRSSYEKVIEENTNNIWIRDKDVFPAPSQEFQDSDDWQEFSEDCVVYSLFANGSNQTSLRDYEYGDKKWFVPNQFFWLPKKKVRELAIKNKNSIVELDLDTDDDRFVYEWIEERRSSLSKEAADLLESATKILEESFKYRNIYTFDHPKYQLNTWDAGFLQLYKMSSPRSRDGLRAAKESVKLVELWSDLEKNRRVLGDKIAKRYSEDTGF